jgi:anti-sigma B factor antagonist
MAGSGSRSNRTEGNAVTTIDSSRVEQRAERTGRAQPEAFSVELRPDRRRVMIVPHGELDLATVPEVAKAVDELIARGFDALIIDLRATSFMDSSGLHLLIQCAQRTDARITVIDGPPAVSRLFDLSGARNLVPFEMTP